MCEHSLCTLFWRLRFLVSLVLLGKLAYRQEPPWQPPQTCQTALISWMVSEAPGLFWRLQVTTNHCCSHLHSKVSVHLIEINHTKVKKMDKGCCIYCLLFTFLFDIFIRSHYLKNRSYVKVTMLMYKLKLNSLHFYVIAVYCYM